MVLPRSLEYRRVEFSGYVDEAVKHITAFAVANGWDSLVLEPFMDSVMVFDVKGDFDRQLLLLAGEDTTMALPANYCGALEKRTLLVVAPEFYAQAYPEGVEEGSYEKLLAHEIAHRLHVRILDGNEEAMGPIWFYEGFAIYVADQLEGSAPRMDEEEMLTIMNDPERGSYTKYGALFRHFANQRALPELIGHAARPDFNEWLLRSPAD